MTILDKKFEKWIEGYIMYLSDRDSASLSDLLEESKVNYRVYKQMPYLLLFHLDDEVAKTEYAVRLLGELKYAHIKLLGLKYLRDFEFDIIYDNLTIFNKLAYYPIVVSDRSVEKGFIDSYMAFFSRMYRDGMFKELKVKEGKLIYSDKWDSFLDYKD